MRLNVDGYKAHLESQVDCIHVISDPTSPTTPIPQLESDTVSRRNRPGFPRLGRGRAP